MLEIIKETSGVVYAPPAENRRPGSMYPRVICLEHSGEANGVLLASFEQYSQGMTVFPIYRSTDDGLTWEWYADVEDTKNGWGNRFQPHLFELPCPLAELPEGTILCAGNSIPDDYSVTDLVVYVSRDQGATWTYWSTIMTGGKARVDDKTGADRPIWEPYLYLDAHGDLVCYYSDERYMQTKQYNQLLCHQVSKDGGKTWGEAVFDVAIADGKLRPGMPIVTRLASGRYFMCYEMVGIPRNPVYGRFSADGLDWGDPADYGTLLETAEGEFFGSMPYCLWVPQGGSEGTVIVSAKRAGSGDCLWEPGYFLANSRGGEGPWYKLPALNNYDARYRSTGYSQGMCLLKDRERLIQLSPAQMNPQKSLIAYGIGRLISK